MGIETALAIGGLVASVGSTAASYAQAEKAQAAQDRRAEIAKKQAAYQQMRDTRQSIREQQVAMAQRMNAASNAGAGQSSGAIGSVQTTASSGNLQQQGISVTGALQRQDQVAANQYASAMTGMNQWQAVSGLGSQMASFGGQLNTWNNQTALNKASGLQPTRNWSIFG